ncbi:MAG: hypothetical protein ACM3W4_04885 [Ignavibacteriales bacterium]
MDPSAWIALAGLAFVMLVQLAATIWWAATTNERVRTLEAKAKEHGDIRDIVIEMRTEMRGFRTAIQDLASGLKEVRKPRTAPAK